VNQIEILLWSVSTQISLAMGDNIFSLVFIKLNVQGGNINEKLIIYYY